MRVYQSESGDWIVTDDAGYKERCKTREEADRLLREKEPPKEPRVLPRQLREKQ